MLKYLFIVQGINREITYQWIGNCDRILEKKVKFLGQGRSLSPITDAKLHINLVKVPFNSANS